MNGKRIGMLMMMLLMVAVYAPAAFAIDMEPVETLKLAEFVLSDFFIYGIHGEIGEAWIEKSVAIIIIRVKVTNVGDLEGSVLLELYVSGPQPSSPLGHPISVKEQSENVTLVGGTWTIVYFSVTKTTVGSYAVKVGDLTGSFTVRNGLSQTDSLLVPEDYFLVAETYERKKVDEVIKGLIDKLQSESATKRDLEVTTNLIKAQEDELLDIKAQLDQMRLVLMSVGSVIVGLVIVILWQVKSGRWLIVSGERSEPP
jgi:hypothetical protein